MTVILGLPEWECPNCIMVHRGIPKPGAPFLHNCAGLSGLTAPLVPKGQRCKVESEEWQDFVKDDSTVAHDNEGRAVSSVKVTRDDGEDIAVFPQTAKARLEFS